MSDYTVYLSGCFVGGRRTEAAAEELNESEFGGRGEVVPWPFPASDWLAEMAVEATAA